MYLMVVFFIVGCRCFHVVHHSNTTTKTQKAGMMRLMAMITATVDEERGPSCVTKEENNFLCQ